MGQVTDLEAWLGMQPGNTDEGLLTRLLAASSQDLQIAVGVSMGAVVDLTEYRILPSSHQVALRHGPATALTSMSVVPSANALGSVLTVIPVSATPSASYAYLLEGRVVVPNRYSQGTQLEIVYKAGYATPPADFLQAVLELAGLRYKERGRIGEHSRSIRGETVSYNTKRWNNFIEGVILHYKNRVYS